MSNSDSSDIELNQRGLLVVISGPSGVGKSTLCARLVEQLGARLSISATTRPKADGEKDGRDYYFMTENEFRRQVSADEFLEHAEVYDFRYGTPAGPVRRDLESRQLVLLEIDVQGGGQINRIFPEAAGIFVLPPNEGSLVQRLGGRNREDAAARAKRLAKACSEHEQAKEIAIYRFFVVNENVNRCVKEIKEIICKERAK